MFNVLAHTFGALPLAASYAVRINLFAAVTSASAAALWFLVAERWLREIVPVRWARLAAAAAGSLVGAFAWTVWNQSTVNEKVYTVSLFSIALTMWLSCRWADRPSGSARDRLLILIAYLIGLTSTNHMMGVLVVPTIGVYLLTTDWRETLRPWVVAMGVALMLGVSNSWAAWTQPGFGGANGLALGAILLAVLAWAVVAGEHRRPALYLGLAAVVAGVSLNYLFLSIRAGHYPAINEGEPTSWSALLDVLNRVQYGKPSVFARQADFPSQVANYLQYFRWQFAGDCTRGFSPSCEWFGTLMAWIFGLLGLLGIVALWQSARKAAAATVTTLVVSFTIALVFYLNFKYGYSIHPGEQLSREVRERDYFFVASFAAWGMVVALGFGAFMRWVVGFLRDRGTESSRWASASPILALAFIPLLGNRVTASRAHETLARQVAVDMLQSVEPYGILITAGDNDTFPLWYAQEVEGVRPDVTLANLSLMNTEWHLRQMRRRVTPTFDPAKAAAIWRGRTWPKPPDPVLSLREGQLDSIPGLSRAPSARSSRFGDVVITYGDDVLEKSDVATVLLIRDNLGRRPIYFSWSDGNYPDSKLGLTQYLVTTGLVRRLNPVPVTTSDSIVLSRGFGYVDLPTTKRLLWETYNYSAASRDRPRGWVDPPSSPILRLYSLVYGIVSEAFLQAGDSTSAARADSVARAVEANMRIPDVGE